MPKVKVDLLSAAEKAEIKKSKKQFAGQESKTAPLRQPHRRRFNAKKIIASIIIVLIVSLAVFSSSIVFSDENLIKNLAKLNLFQQVGRLIGSGDKALAGEADDRINVLLIGMGGRGHEGGTLADTIILGSFKPSTNQVAMLSIPRDLSVPTNDGWIKINAINAYAEQREEKSGGREMARVLSDLLQTDIHYFATVDFSGFEKLIDEFGGVEIEVERDLIDPQYPIRGKEYVFPLENRYETLHIKKGRQQMDGGLALKYARSRHALGIEGSDFARSRRQQKILAALKEKIFSVGTFLNPKRINSLLTAYNEHIYTNLEIWEMLRLAQLGRDIDTSQIISYTLSDGPDGLLHPRIINEAYVLLPDDGNYQAIRNLWQNIFYAPDTKSLTTTGSDVAISVPTETVPPAATEDKDDQPEPTVELIAEPAPIADYRDENATLEIRNGTWTGGYAGQEKTKLTAEGFTVSAAINADRHDYPQTLIYDLSGGDFPGTTAALTEIYGRAILTEIPTTIESTADFVIILGTN